jgi:spermidine synthase/MFS family permease
MRNKNSSAEPTLPPLIINHQNLPPTCMCRWILLGIAFLCGAAIMIIELAGNKILAPIFGNTLYTWTGLIGIILVAISGGYYFGGWLADKKPYYSVLAHLILTSALFTLLIPFIKIAANIFFAKINIIWGPAFSSLVFFAIPAFLLGCVTPFTIKLASSLSSDKHIGISAGYIGMLSILGSVMGTFGTGFILIPAIGVRTIFLLTGIVLAFLALATYSIFTIARKKKILYTSMVISIIIFLPLLIFGATPKTPWDVLFEKDTFYHRILVIKEFRMPEKIILTPDKRGFIIPFTDAIKTIMLDTTIEGGQYENSPEPPFAYQGYWRLSKVFSPTIENALFLGGGSFYCPEALASDSSTAKVEVVEIDPEVVEVGKKFFRVNEYPQMKIITSDARRYLCSSNKRYNLIFGDAYNGVRNIPAHLVTLEFFSLVKEHLTNKGVYIMNIASAVKGEKSELLLSIVKTLRKVFNNVYVYAPYPDLANAQNIIIAASVNENAQNDVNKRTIHEPALENLLNTYVSPDSYDTTNAPIFTDDYNPAEYIIAKSLIP